VIGAGPAGLSAAVQLRKERIPFIIFEKRRPGGLLWYANRVDNLLGLRGMSGIDLCRIMEEHAKDMGVKIQNTEVVSLAIEKDDFSIFTEKRHWISKFVILATGSTPSILNIPSVLYQVEDYTVMKGKRLLIIGGGDLALDNALRAYGSGVEVAILHRSRIKANEGLFHEVVSNSIPFYRGAMDSVELVGGTFYHNGEKFDYLASFIGRSPNRSLLPHGDEIELSYPSHSTSVKGLYVIGDAASVENSQAAYAMSSGLSAAMDISRRLKKDGDSP
jgi:thioredoxin reductase